METCLLIALWMGHTLEVPVYRCFDTPRMASLWVAGINSDPLGGEWLSRWITLAEIKREFPNAKEVPDS